MRNIPVPKLSVWVGGESGAFQESLNRWDSSKFQIARIELT